MLYQRQCDSIKTSPLVMKYQHIAAVKTRSQPRERLEITSYCTTDIALDYWTITKQISFIVLYTNVVDQRRVLIFLD